jgi:D-lactate dehydrogenase
MTARFDVQYTSLETICREADIISIHIPLTPATKYLINEEKIGMMKPGVMLINTARGGIVDTAAVIAALKSGQIGSFGMDVYEKEAGVFFYDYSEQVLEDDTLALLTTFPNVLITAHQAFLTQTALQNISDTTKDNLQCMAEGKSNGNELNPVAIIQAAQMIA